MRENLIDAHFYLLSIPLLEFFLNRIFSFSILHWSGNKDCFIDKFIRLHRGSTEGPIFKNIEDIPSRLVVFDVVRQPKIFLIVSIVALHSSELRQFFSNFMQYCFVELLLSLSSVTGNFPSSYPVKSVKPVK